MSRLADHYRTADAGAQTSSPHQQEILDEFIARALGTRVVGSVLDLGSGRGANLGTLGRHAASVVAADVSEEALVDGAATQVTDARVNRVVLPGRGLPFKDSAFEVSVCTEVLEHVDDLAGTGAELERVTASGGWLIVSSPNYRNVMGLVKLWKDWRSGRHDFDPWHAHEGGYEGFMTAPKLRKTFPHCTVEHAVGADYAFALGIMWGPLRWRLSKYLLLRPGRTAAFAPWGMQYYLLLRRQ